MQEGDMMHLSLVGSRSGPLVMAKTRMTFRSGPEICGHTTEWSDVHRPIRFDGERVMFFTEVEYQLFSLLLANHLQRKKEVSYMQIASEVFGCAFHEELLPIIRKRVSAIRKKVAGFGIDIIS